MVTKTLFFVFEIKIDKVKTLGQLCVLEKNEFSATLASKITPCAGYFILSLEKAVACSQV